MLHCQALSLRGSAPLYLGKPSSRLNSFSLLLDGRLFVSATQLELFEQSALGKLILENFEGLLYIIVKYFYFQYHHSFLLEFGKKKGQHGTKH